MAPEFHDFSFSKIGKVSPALSLLNRIGAAQPSTNDASSDSVSDVDDDNMNVDNDKSDTPNSPEVPSLLQRMGSTTVSDIKNASSDEPTSSSASLEGHPQSVTMESSSSVGRISSSSECVESSSIPLRNYEKPLFSQNMPFQTPSCLPTPPDSGGLIPSSSVLPFPLSPPLPPSSVSAPSLSSLGASTRTSYIYSDAETLSAEAMNAWSRPSHTDNGPVGQQDPITIASFSQSSTGGEEEGDRRGKELPSHDAFVGSGCFSASRRTDEVPEPNAAPHFDTPNSQYIPLADDVCYAHSCDSLQPTGTGHSISIPTTATVSHKELSEEAKRILNKYKPTTRSSISESPVSDSVTPHPHITGLSSPDATSLASTASSPISPSQPKTASDLTPEQAREKMLKESLKLKLQSKRVSIDNTIATESHSTPKSASSSVQVSHLSSSQPPAAPSPFTTASVLPSFSTSHSTAAGEEERVNDDEAYLKRRRAESDDSHLSASQKKRRRANARKLRQGQEVANTPRPIPSFPGNGKKPSSSTASDVPIYDTQSYLPHPPFFMFDGSVTRLPFIPPPVAFPGPAAASFHNPYHVSIFPLPPFPPPAMPMTAGFVSNLTPTASAQKPVMPSPSSHRTPSLPPGQGSRPISSSPRTTDSSEAPHVLPHSQKGPRPGDEDHAALSRESEDERKEENGNDKLKTVDECTIAVKIEESEGSARLFKRECDDSMDDVKRLAGKAEQSNGSARAAIEGPECVAQPLQNGQASQNRSQGNGALHNRSRELNEQSVSRPETLALNSQDSQEQLRHPSPIRPDPVSEAGGQGQIDRIASPICDANARSMSSCWSTTAMGSEDAVTVAEATPAMQGITDLRSSTPKGFSLSPRGETTMWESNATVSSPPGRRVPSYRAIQSPPRNRRATRYADTYRPTYYRGRSRSRSPVLPHRNDLDRSVQSLPLRDRLRSISPGYDRPGRIPLNRLQRRDTRSMIRRWFSRSRSRTRSLSPVYVNRYRSPPRGRPLLRSFSPSRSDNSRSPGGFHPGIRSQRPARSPSRQYRSPSPGWRRRSPSLEYRLRTARRLSPARRSPSPRRPVPPSHPQPRVLQSYRPSFDQRVMDSQESTLRNRVQDQGRFHEDLEAAVERRGYALVGSGAAHHPRRTEQFSGYPSSSSRRQEWSHEGIARESGSPKWPPPFPPQSFFPPTNSQDVPPVSSTNYMRSPRGQTSALLPLCSPKNTGMALKSPAIPGRSPAPLNSHVVAPSRLDNETSRISVDVEASEQGPPWSDVDTSVQGTVMATPSGIRAVAETEVVNSHIPEILARASQPLTVNDKLSDGEINSVTSCRGEVGNQSLTTTNLARDLVPADEMGLRDHTASPSTSGAASIAAPASSHPARLSVETPSVEPVNKTVTAARRSVPPRALSSAAAVPAKPPPQKASTAKEPNLPMPVGAPNRSSNDDLVSSKEPQLNTRTPKAKSAVLPAKPAYEKPQQGKENKAAKQASVPKAGADIQTVKSRQKPKSKARQGTVMREGVVEAASRPVLQTRLDMPLDHNANLAPECGVKLGDRIGEEFHSTGKPNHTVDIHSSRTKGDSVSDLSSRLSDAKEGSRGRPDNAGSRRSFVAVSPSASQSGVQQQLQDRLSTPIQGVTSVAHEQGSTSPALLGRLTESAVNALNDNRVRNENQDRGRSQGRGRGRGRGGRTIHVLPPKPRL